MRRRVFRPPSRRTGAGTRPRLDLGAQRPLLREHRLNMRSCLDRPELGPSRERGHPAGIKVRRRKGSNEIREGSFFVNNIF